MLWDFYGMEHTMTCSSEGRVIHVLLLVTQRGWGGGLDQEFFKFNAREGHLLFCKKKDQDPPALPTQEKTYFP